MSRAVVTSVSASDRHAFSKVNQPVVRLVVGLGVEGDAHSGTTVQHLSRIRRDPTQPRFQDGLLGAVLDRDADGGVVRRAGVMAVVLTGGDVRPGDSVPLELPGLPYRALVPV